MTEDKSPSWKKQIKKRVENNKLTDYLRIGLILIIFILFSNHLLLKNEVTKTKLGVTKWPLSSEKHLQMSQVLFNNGYETQAVEEYKQAKKLYQSFSFLDINKRIKLKLEYTEKLINQPQKINQEINHLEKILKSKPYSRDILLYLSSLSYQLWNDGKAEEYWQKAFYLDPNNETVQKMGKIIEKIK